MLNRNGPDLEPIALDAREDARDQFKTGTPENTRDQRRPRGPLVDVGLRFKNREAGLCEQVAETHRPPTVEVIVDVVGTIGPSHGLAWHDNEDFPPGFQLGVERLEFGQGMRRMFERVIGEDYVRTSIWQFRRGRVHLDAIYPRNLSRSRIDFDANPSRTSQRLEQKSTAASEVKNGVGFAHCASELREIGPCAELTVSALPLEIGAVVVRGRIHRGIVAPLEMYQQPGAVYAP